MCAPRFVLANLASFTLPLVVKISNNEAFFTPVATAAPPGAWGWYKSICLFAGAAVVEVVVEEVVLAVVAVVVAVIAVESATWPSWPSVLPAVLRARVVSGWWWRERRRLSWSF